ncbi:MAG: ABC transporter permease [Actinomycetota bacterium]|nr:ABC transporter permease [Actinomycetota bacterium]
MATNQEDIKATADVVAAVEGDPTAANTANYFEVATFGEYVKASIAKVKGGDSGILPVIVGLVIIAVIFQSLNSNFLSAGNLINLLSQGAAYILLSLGEIYALLLGEIDLSIGYVAGVAGIVMAQLASAQHNWPWWAAIIVALIVATAIGALQGTIITRVGLPSFVVTLAGLLGWQGVMLIILGNGGTLPISSNVLNDLANGSLNTVATVISIVAIVAIYAAVVMTREIKRKRKALHRSPASLAYIKIGGAVIGGVALILISNANRGVLVPIRGLPWVVLIVVAFVVMWTILLSKTRYGRYVYAVGGNAEAARRGGVNLARVRTGAFALASLTAGAAGIIYASRLRSVSTSLDGGTLVLYAVAAAVIGGTSLFGGKGKPIHAILGGIVIAGIDNGMGLLGISAAARLVVTGLVLLAAVLIDALARRSKTAR